MLRLSKTPSDIAKIMQLAYVHIMPYNRLRDSVQRNAGVKEETLWQ